ncbi:hypothetical protein PY257_00465 [Ramlibacter sp. H39-3-26]|uniref:hypothetical protein n=1 Tax=Curvibacter soli TaxID=3031331 RepID=UPI0023DB3260|nr:hypothetical protein [Ramlibacter sp. H39-3-26]MDF1483678.1 hypothetical protein [Ramlibacter sp. H39-3-26]
MAIGWLSALKMIPWGEVIEATPHVVKAARNLFRSTRKASTASDGDGLPETLAPAGDAETALRQLQRHVQRLEAEQRQSAELIATLAEQNAQVVQAIEVLRVRTRLLLRATAVLGVVAAGLLAWVLRH